MAYTLKSAVSSRLRSLVMRDPETGTLKDWKAASSGDYDASGITGSTDASWNKVGGGTVSCKTFDTTDSGTFFVWGDDKGPQWLGDGSNRSTLVIVLDALLEDTNAKAGKTSEPQSGASGNGTLPTWGYTLNSNTGAISAGYSQSVSHSFYFTATYTSGGATLAFAQNGANGPCWFGVEGSALALDKSNTNLLSGITTEFNGRYKRIGGNTQSQTTDTCLKARWILWAVFNETVDITELQSLHSDPVTYFLETSSVTTINPNRFQRPAMSGGMQVLNGGMKG
jgi:hypothetical protein